MAWSVPIMVEDGVELPKGTVLDERFVIRSVLGEGGVGCVYLADDRELGHPVALKILIPRYRGRAEREQRLLNEAEFARRVGEHAALPRLFGAGRLRDLDGCPYVAWEVVQGGDLNSVLLSRQRIPPRPATLWARQLADALFAMHQAGVVHRDVTVTNVFIEDPDGDAKVRLIDLSHAAVVPEADAPSRRLTREFEVPGAHRFMPPEQTLAFAPHPKMDVFSFGVVLHEMLTGRNPFDHVRDRETYIELQRQGQLHVPRIDRRGYPEVSEAMVELVAGCTANNVDARLDMAEVLRRLDAEISAVPVALVREQAHQGSPVGQGRVLSIVEASDVEDEPVRPEPEADRRGFTDPAVPEGSAGVAVHDDPSDEGHGSLRTVVVVALATVVVVVSAAMLLLGSDTPDVAAPAPMTPEPAEVLPRAEAARPIDPVGDEVPDSLEPDVRPASPAETPAPAPGPAAVDEPVSPAPAADDGSTKAAEPEKPRPAEAAEPSKPKPSGARKPPPRAKAPAHETEACRSTVAAASGAEESGAWVRLEILTRKRKCFGDRAQWARLRAHALLETERYAECSALADRYKDPFVQKYAHTCRAQQNRP